MRDFIVRRLLQFIPTLIAASIVIFLIITLSPGDPVAMMLGTDATEQEIELERARLGLDEPIYVRYATWVSDVAHLNLGQSMTSGRPVVELVGKAFPNTLRLAGTSMVLAVFFGVILGILSAVQPGSKLDSFITALNSLGLSIPSFWLGILLILLFAVRLKVLPPSGAGDPQKSVIENLKYLIMPVCSIALSQTSIFSRFTRSSLMDVIAADYIRTARAKGLRERVILLRHALRNAMIPVITIVGIQFGRLLGGAVITESVFAYSGIGRLVVTSILNRDYPVVQATLMLVVLIFLLTNLAIDLAYAYLDPRVRL